MQKSPTWGDTFSALRDDVKRYWDSKSVIVLGMKLFHSPGIFFSCMYRIEHYLMLNRLLPFRIIGIICYPLYFLVTYYILDYHIEPYVTIGSGLFLHNRSIVITDNTVIGKNASIMGQVTIGTGFETNPFTLRIGNNIKIGVGAKIIANRKLEITDNVVIGANAVVTGSIEKSGTYVGIPAKRLPG